MKVILQKDVPNLGDAGDIKVVADGYARNFLIPRKLVIAAQEGSTRALEHQKQLIALRVEKRNKEMGGVAEKLKALGTIDIPVRVGAKSKLFGSVTAGHVAAALQEKGFPIEKRKVELGDNLKSLGTYKIRLRLSEQIFVPFTVNVVVDLENSEIEEEVPVAAAPAAPAEASAAEENEGAASGEA